MKSRLPKLSYSNVIASIALFVALGGAAVAAGLPRNSVGASQLKRGAVTTAKLRKGAVASGKLAPKSVIAGKLGPNAVLPGNIGNGAVTSAKIAAGAVIASSIKNGVIDQSQARQRSRHHVEAGQERGDQPDHRQRRSYAEQAEREFGRSSASLKTRTDAARRLRRRRQ